MLEKYIIPCGVLLVLLVLFTCGDVPSETYIVKKIKFSFLCTKQ